MQEIGITGISLPVELLEYKKNTQKAPEGCSNINIPDFGVKLVKNDIGELEYSAYYSDSGELIKQVYYEGSSVSLIKHFRNKKLYYSENYKESKLYRKTTYDKNGNIFAITVFEYNRQNQIKSIRKSMQSNRFTVEYGYDDLKRVNSRKILVNNEVISEQEYKYDILDRIVEYKDNSQKINVYKISPNNKLIKYTITDSSGNEINIINKYLCSDYIGTDIELNGHKTSVKDLTYTDNVMLKKPFTSEDDLDFAVSSILKKSENGMTRRIRENNAIDIRINSNIEKNPMPISIRKLALLNIA